MENMENRKNLVTQLKAANKQISQKVYKQAQQILDTWCLTETPELSIFANVVILLKFIGNDGKHCDMYIHDYDIVVFRFQDKTAAMFNLDFYNKDEMEVAKERIEQFFSPEGCKPIPGTVSVIKK